MKAVVILCTLALFAVVSAQDIDFLANSPFLGKFGDTDPKSNLQKIFVGFWQNAGLKAPVQAINCFDQETANLTLIFIGDALKEIAKQDAIDFPVTVLNFQKQFPQNVADCLGNDEEIQTLRDAYNVSQVPEVVLEATIEKYVVTHLASLHSNASTGYFYYFQGQWTPLGTLFGQIVQQIVNSTSVVQSNVEVVAAPSEGPKDALQQYFNGLFEQAGLPDPTTIVDCYNDTTAQITLDFARDVINDLADDNYLALLREYQVYKGALTPKVTDCLKSNDEFQAAYKAYGFPNETTKTLIQKYTTFAIKHHNQLLDDTKAVDTAFDSDDYHAAGLATGQLFQEILTDSAVLGTADPMMTSDFNDYTDKRVAEYVLTSLMD